MKWSKKDLLWLVNNDFQPDRISISDSECGTTFRGVSWDKSGELYVDGQRFQYCLSVYYHPQGSYAPPWVCDCCVRDSESRAVARDFGKYEGEAGPKESYEGYLDWLRDAVAKNDDSTTYSLLLRELYSQLTGSPAGIVFSADNVEGRYVEIHGSLSCRTQH